MSQRVTPPSADVIEAIEDGTAHVTRRLEIFEDDGTTYWSPSTDESVQQRLLTESSSVTIDSTRDERRMFDCSLDNSDGILHPNPFGGFWYDKILVPWKGVILPDDTTWECPLGVFMIDQIEYDNFPNMMRVSCRDQTKRMMNSKLVNSVTFDASIKVGDLVKAVAENAGVDPLKIDVPNDTPTLGKDLDIERGTSRWEVAKQVAVANEYQLYFDALGWLVLEPVADPFGDPFVYTFTTGTKGNLVKFTKTVNDSELYNHVIVVTEPAGDSLGYFGEATNTDPNSPTRIARIGDRLAPIYTLNSIASDNQAQRVAKRLLTRSALESYAFNFSSITYPWIDVEVTCRVLEPKAVPGDPNKFILESATVLLGPGPMDATADRITVVGDTTDPYTPPDGDTPGDPGDPSGTPDPPPDPTPNPGTSDNVVGIATYNMGAHQGTDKQKTDDFLALAKRGADIICVQEGDKYGKTMDAFIHAKPEWAVWRGDNAHKREVAILYKTGLGTVVAKRSYLEHSRQYVGENGTSSTIKDKYCMRLDIQLKKSARTITILNHHSLPSATMSKQALGKTEWQKRRDFFQQQMSVLTGVIDSCVNNVFVCGDFNATAAFDLMAPLMSRVNNDHTYITLDTRTIDFVAHKTPNSHVSKNRDDKVSTSSDHAAIIVFYNVTVA